MGIYLIPLCVIVAILVIAFLFASLQQVKHKTRYIVLYVIAIIMLFAVIPINEYLTKFTQISRRIPAYFNIRYCGGIFLYVHCRFAEIQSS